MKASYKSFGAFLLLLWLSLALPFQAESFCYDGAPIPYVALPTTSPSGSTPITFNGDDSFSNVINIGFTFNFFGVDYTQLIVGSNGIVSFNTALAGQFCDYHTASIPNSTFPSSQNAIMFPWVDLFAEISGTFFYYTTGTAPNRQFVIVFNDVWGFGNTCISPPRTNTQGVILYENSNEIDIVLASVQNCSQLGSDKAVEGIQNAGGTTAYPVPNRNNTVWTATNDSYRFSPSPNSGQIGPISGASSVCGLSGTSQLYSIAPVTGATGYTWSVPSDWTITDDNGTSINVTVGNMNGTIGVTANDTCGASNPQTLTVTVNPPNQPGSISGATIACEGTTRIYTIPPVASATSYTWSVPPGWIIINNTGTSITVTVGNSGGTISVTADNACGSSAPQTLTVTVGQPNQPGPISGSTTVCRGTSQKYSITPVTGATSYTWSVPSGWTITTNAGTSITVTVGGSSGIVSVRANNVCGSSNTQTLSVTVNTLPNQPGPISGSTTVCTGTSQTYSIAPVAGATSYTWSVPSGWTVTNNSGTSIAVIVGSAGETISVRANNNCGSSATQVLGVTILVPNQPGPISGSTRVCSSTSQIYSIEPVTGATSYTWSVPFGWTITSDSGTSITVKVGGAGGTISVTANNACGSTSPQTLGVAIHAVPNQPKPISGPASVCTGTSQIYSTEPVKDATGYTWNVPSGWTITKNGGISITVAVGSTGGTISVKANNDCGSSSPQTIGVAINTIPNQPGLISGLADVCTGTSQTYSIAPVADAASYTWNVPSGWKVTHDSGTSITVTVGSASGTVGVIANNSCGSSVPQTLNVAINTVPRLPRHVSGAPSVCAGTSQTYSIESVARATNYTWRVPSGWKITNNNGTSITVKVGDAGGIISVTANNACGSSAPRKLSVSIKAVPNQPESVSGPTVACTGTSQIYFIKRVKGATSYTWSVPASWTITNNTGTSITVAVGDAGGTISVTANNVCGSSIAQTLNVSADEPIPILPAIAGPSDVNFGQTASYVVPLEVNGVTYAWSYSGEGVLINPEGNQAILKFGPQATNGILSVSATCSCGKSVPSILAISIQILPPAEVCVKFEKEIHHLCCKNVNVIRWGASPSPGVAFYRIYRNDRLIAEVDASQLEYKDFAQIDCSTLQYGVTSVGTNGQESKPITVDIKNKAKKMVHFFPRSDPSD